MASEYSNREKRSFFRHPISVPLRLRAAKKRVSGSSASCDLSQTGLSFFWDKELPRGLSINITLPIKEKRFKINGKIVYSDENLKTGLFKIGVLFNDAASAFQAKLAEEVLEILEYRKKVSRRLGRVITEEEAAARWVRKYGASFSKNHSRSS